MEADRNSTRPSSPDPIQSRIHGARALKALMTQIHESTEADFARLYELRRRAGTDEDPRDYEAIARLTDAALLAWFVEAPCDERAGFVNALAELLSINVDGCGAGLEWTPMAATRQAWVTEGRHG